ncbi:hypothetical protein [Mesorhizobium sp. AD1-1]|uniref:hypothetical protein n=1 Tax=Mesorhizobium sp. AD1-1 TaxID=2876621 RepID=UPI00398C591D
MLAHTGRVLITEGRVHVGGKVVRDAALRVDLDLIVVDDRPLVAERKNDAVRCVSGRPEEVQTGRFTARPATGSSRFHVSHKSGRGRALV